MGLIKAWLSDGGTRDDPTVRSKALKFTQVLIGNIAQVLSHPGMSLERK